MPAQILAPLDLVVTAGRLLITNGHGTRGTILALEKLAAAYDLRVTVLPGWQWWTVVDPTGKPARVIPASPTTVQMGVVSATLAVVECASESSKPPPPDQVAAQLEDAGRAPASSLAAFVLACATGACALAVIFGAHRPSSFLLIAGAAGIGGLVRRVAAGHGVQLVGQALLAGLIAGLAGSLSIAMDATSPARLVAVCPAMVLVPGPHLLNGALDVAGRWMGIGIGRLLYGGVVLLSISIGLFLGLLPGGGLPVTATSSSVPVAVDVGAAAVAAGSYCVYFSLPVRLIVWPVVVGALAHGTRWVALTLGSGLVGGSLLACVVSGLLLAPITRRRHCSFAGVGFAAVVALVPGVFVFRATTGIVDLTTHPTTATVTAVAADLSTASLTLCAMGVGLVLGQRVSDPSH